MSLKSLRKHVLALVGLSLWLLSFKQLLR